jgi:serine/threonine protein kinase
MSSTSSDSSVSEPYDKSKGEEFKFMTLNDKYVLIDKIGAGTFSAVWLAICIKNMELYAIKIQHLSNYDDGEKEAKFLTKIMESGGCDNLPKLVEYFNVENPEDTDYVNICMVMNLCIGSVYQLMSRAGFSDGYNIKVANKIIYDVMKANYFLNKMRYIHTDIKPENVLIEGLNILFSEFREHVKNSENINETMLNLYKSMKLDKLPKNTTIYKDKKSEFRQKKKAIFKNYSKQMIAKFKEICNKYTDEKDNTLDPNYYKKTFNMPHQYDLSKCNYILSDFGTVKSFDRDNTDVIQTRYYRAPEVLLECKWDYRADIWSIGCLYFELLNNDVIFNPNVEDDEQYSEDMHHLYWIHQLIDIDHIKLKSGKKYKKYYDQKGLKYEGEIEKLTFEEVICSDKEKEYTAYDIEFITNFLKKIFTDVDKRETLPNLIKYICTYAN